jgi:hypothetical protein
MEAIYYSETSVDFQRTMRRYIPEDFQNVPSISYLWFILQGVKITMADEL